jgi:hypothetical protein
MIGRGKSKLKPSGERAMCCNLFNKFSQLRTVVELVVVISCVGVGTAWSYMRTASSELGREIRNATPIAFELKRLDDFTKVLIPDIQANQRVAAQLDVETEYAEREIKEMCLAQDEARGQMQKLRIALDESRETFEFGGKTFTRPEVEQDLARRLERFDNVAAQLTSKEKILTARRRTLEAATDKIRQYEHQRDLLVEKSESLQAELKLLEVAQTAGGFRFDNSKLAQAKELALEVEKKVRTLQKVVETDRHLDGDIPVDADSRPVTQRFDERFAPAK